MTTKRSEPILGYPIDPETIEPLDLPEEEHWYTCNHCGQAVDKRDLAQVFHHEDDDHEPIETH